jgi:hypothetical protein
MKTKYCVVFFVFFVSLSLLLFTQGCLLFVAGGAAAAGAGGYAYVKGEAVSTETVTLDRAWNASLAAMKDLEFPVTSQKKDALQAELTARDASDKKITVSLKKVSEKSTEIHIRVGTFGDESLSRVILDKIKKHL